MKCPQCEVDMKREDYRDHTTNPSNIAALYACPECEYQVNWYRGERLRHLDNLDDDTYPYSYSEMEGDMPDGSYHIDEVLLLDEDGKLIHRDRKHYEKSKWI